VWDFFNSSIIPSFLTGTRGLAVLVEMGYFSNQREAILIRTGSFQNHLARTITDGICNYFD
jgi:N-acetylmuramoyl-L-alanine amidase